MLFPMAWVPAFLNFGREKGSFPGVTVEKKISGVATVNLKQLCRFFSGNTVENRIIRETTVIISF